MDKELKACPFCGGAVQFHSDEDCHGCHYIECAGCKAMFDFSPTTDPENQCDSLHELQCGIAHAWNTRTMTRHGGEAVDVVGYVAPQDLEWQGDCSLRKIRILDYTIPVMTVAQHQRILAASAPPALTVWCGPMPESNGKSNFTAILMRKGADMFDGITGGITIARSEYPDRVQYEADRMRYLIGELDAEPDILAYDPDKHSGYTRPADQVADDLTMVKVSRELLERIVKRGMRLPDETQHQHLEELRALLAKP